MNNVQTKVLELCHNGEYGKAWAYWKLMGCDYGIFLGEVPATEFITGDVLADKINLTAGLSQNCNIPWLKFLLNHEIIYVPKKSIRNSLSWNDINRVSAVYGRSPLDASVTIGGYDYVVSLLNGGNTDYVPMLTGWDDVNTHHSEWNKLFYPIHSDVYTKGSNSRYVSVPFNQWASYSDIELLMDVGFGRGAHSWTQGTHTKRGVEYKIVRGVYGISSATMCTSTSSTENSGWRPALRFKI